VIWQADWQGLALHYLAPLLGALVAIDSAKNAQSGRLPLMSAAQRWRQHCLTFSVGLVPLAAVLTVGWAVLVGLAVSDGGEVRLLGSAALVLVGQLLVLAFFAAFGLLIGQLTGPILAATIVIAVGMGELFLTYSNLGGFMPLYSSGGIPLVGQIRDPVWAALQIGSLMAVAALCLWISTIRQNWALAARILGLAASAGILLAPLFPFDRYMWQADPNPATICSQGSSYSAVQYCTYAVRWWRVEQMMPALDQLMLAASDSGYDFLVPDVVLDTEVIDQDVFLRDRQDQDLRVAWSDFETSVGPDGTLIAGYSTAATLVAPYHCPDYGESLNSEATFALIDALAVTWIDLAGLDSYTSLTTSTLSPESAAAVMARLDSCDLP
jgi:hypothetical protein